MPVRNGAIGIDGANLFIRCYQAMNTAASALVDGEAALNALPEPAEGTLLTDAEVEAIQALEDIAEAAREDFVVAYVVARCSIDYDNANPRWLREAFNYFYRNATQSVAALVDVPEMPHHFDENGHIVWGD